MSKQVHKMKKVSKEDKEFFREYLYKYIVNYLYWKHVVLKNIGRALK